MTTTEHLEAARRHIAAALEQHKGSVELDRATFLLLRAVREIDSERRKDSTP